MCYLCCLKLSPATGTIAAAAAARRGGGGGGGGGGVGVVVQRAVRRGGTFQREVLPLLAIHAAICKAHLQ
jgi:hypothetical protein